ncbi:hypothetical protein GCM10017779_40500 [Streptomyces capillispiralis]|nr:hypothetical protein GCM10017779_40500 [Streptomyces capillispiralis]
MPTSMTQRQMPSGESTAWRHKPYGSSIDLVAAKVTRGRTGAFGGASDDCFGRGRA